MEKYDVIVVGGGAAGLFAAIFAARLGVRVLLLEKMEKPGRKVRITGKGRCNITNIADTDNILEKVKVNAVFVKESLDIFGSRQVIEFLELSGLELVTERGGRVFPKSGKAWDVADALIREARKSGVDVRCYADVECILSVSDDNTKEEHIAGVEFLSDGHLCRVESSSVILATGGVSYPSTGSTGDGYRFAYDFGHRIVSVRPSLVGLRTDGKSYAQLNGLQLKNVEVSLIVNSKVMQSEFGEMEFFSYGIGGAIILKISRLAVDALIDGNNVSVIVDLKPALSKEKLQGRITREMESEPSLILEGLLRKMLPSKIINMVVSQSGLRPTSKISQMTAKEIERIIDTLKGLQLKVTDYGDFSEAIVTAGGVDVSEIDPLTMESKIISGLFFAGEIMDIDADTGGYNLQLAFSTGYTAGNNAAKKI